MSQKTRKGLRDVEGQMSTSPVFSPLERALAHVAGSSVTQGGGEGIRGRVRAGPAVFNTLRYQNIVSDTRYSILALQV